MRFLTTLGNTKSKHINSLIEKQLTSHKNTVKLLHTSFVT